MKNRFHQQSHLVLLPFDESKNDYLRPSIAVQPIIIAPFTSISTSMKDDNRCMKARLTSILTLLCANNFFHTQSVIAFSINWSKTSRFRRRGPDNFRLHALTKWSFKELPGDFEVRYRGICVQYTRRRPCYLLLTTLTCFCFVSSAHLIITR
jgi:hypothetical protein